MTTEEIEKTNASLDKKKFNEERIRAWKEQRLAIAKEAALERKQEAALERQMRGEQNKRERLEEMEALDKEKRQQIQQQLPSLEKINEAKKSFLLENQQKKQYFIKKIAALVLVSALLTTLIAFFTTAFYEAESIVTIKTNSLNDNNPGSSILPTSVSPNIMQNIFAAREYIFSREMMNRMEEGQGFLSYFKKNDTHFLSKPISNNFIQKDDYNYYKHRVKVAVDIQEGLLRIKVQGKNETDARRFAEALLNYAEDWVNTLSNRMFSDKIKEAEETLAKRKKNLQLARKRIVNFQISKRDLNPRETTAAIYKHLHEIKTNIKHTEREIAVYKRAEVNNSPVVDRLRSQLSVLRQQKKGLNKGLVDNGEMSMNKILSGFESAVIVKEVAEKEWEVALNSLEKIKSEVFNQRQYFLTIVPPTTSSLPAEPQLLKIFLLILILLYSSTFILSLLKTAFKISVKT